MAFGKWSVYAEVSAFVSARDEGLFLFLRPKAGASARKEEKGMRVDPKQVQQLRSLTGAGVMECKRALEDSLGDFEIAKLRLQEAFDRVAAKKAERVAGAGLVDSYIHGDGRIGVLIEVRCETDFLSGSEEFRRLVRDLALQVASEAPTYVRAEDVPPELVSEVERKAEATALALGKPERAIPSIVTGKVRKYLSQVCLMEQPFIRDRSLTMTNLVNAFSAKAGENVRVEGFTRYHIG
jgi:elongation factor Ts